MSSPEKLRSQTIKTFLISALMPAPRTGPGLALGELSSLILPRTTQTRKVTFMRTLLTALVLLSSSSYALADATVKAKVIGAESQLKVGSVSGFGAGTAVDESSQQAFGGGADLEFGLSEPVRVGLGFGVTQFDTKDKTAYRDMALSAYGTYDLLSQDVVSFYGKGGISYNLISLDDRDQGPVKVSYDNTGLLNYDLGLGARFKLAHNVNFGLEYTRTDTFSRNDVQVKNEGLGLVSTDAELKNISLTSNQLTASLAYSF